jgi:uncharacterized iron-regulated protein
MRRSPPLLLAALALLLGACASSTGQTLGAPGAGWQAELQRQHPLVGIILDLRRRARVDRDEVLRELRGARYVLLGETHDNPDHHALQGELLQALAVDVVAFEMLSRDRQSALDALPSPSNAAGIREAVQWEGSGWPAFALYAPVFDAALRSGARLRAAGLPRSALSPLFGGGGPAAVDAALTERYGLDHSLSAELREAWLDELFAAHCEVVPRESLGPMLLAQRLRDAAMAASLDAPRNALIAGAGHLRRDRGVPALLPPPTTGAASGTRTLAFLEVEASEQTVADALAGLSVDGSAAAGPPYDFVWFTPAAKRTDPCAALRAVQRKAHSAAP